MLCQKSTFKNRDVAKWLLIGLLSIPLTYHVTQLLHCSALLWYSRFGRQHGGGSRYGVVVCSLHEGCAVMYLILFM